MFVGLPHSELDSPPLPLLFVSGDAHCLPADLTCAPSQLTLQPADGTCPPPVAACRPRTNLALLCFPPPPSPLHSHRLTARETAQSPAPKATSPLLHWYTYTSVSVRPSVHHTLNMRELWTCGAEWVSESVAFGWRTKGLKNAPAIRGNVLTRAPAKRLIEKINSTLRIKFGAKARLAKRKEAKQWERRCFVVVAFRSILFI